MCDQCDYGYDLYTCRHLFERVDEYSTITAGMNAM